MSDETSGPVVRHPGGRPKATQPRANLSSWVLAEHYERLVKRANARNTSVSGYVREIMEKHLNPHRKP